MQNFAYANWALPERGVSKVLIVGVVAAFPLNIILFRKLLTSAVAVFAGKLYSVCSCSCIPWYMLPLLAATLVLAEKTVPPPPPMFWLAVELAIAAVARAAMNVFPLLLKSFVVAIVVVVLVEIGSAVVIEEELSDEPVLLDAESNNAFLFISFLACFMLLSCRIFYFCVIIERE